MRRLASAALAAALAALLVAGCGGGGTTTIVEKTVTVETSGDAETGGGEGQKGEAVQTSEEGSAGEEDQTGEEGSAGEEDQTAEEGKIEAPTRVVHLQTFRSPSGNIGCAMFEGGARCDIRKREWSPPPHPSSCSEMVDYGQGLSVGHAGKASFVCAGDTTLDPGAAALGYGEASEVGGTQCMSASTGITCANHAGHGFFISIGSYKIF